MSDTPDSPQPTPDLPRAASAYDLFIAVLAVVSMGVIGWQLTLSKDSEISSLLTIFDFGFCFLFLIDYIHSIVVAPRKWRYIFTWGIFDLASSVPAIGPFRFARIARLFRFLRLIRSLRMLFKVYRRDKAAFSVAAAMLAAIVVIIGATAAVLHLEHAQPGASITTGPRAAWWSVVTVSTVGYGDLTPITPSGRVLAVVLMVLGIGMFATFAGAISNVFMRHVLQQSTGPTIEERLEQLESNHFELIKQLKNIDRKL